MKPCLRHKKNLALLAAGVLESAKRMDLEQHLQTCAGCRQYWQEIRRVCAEHAAVAEAAPAVEESGKLYFHVARRIQPREQFRPWLPAGRWRVAMAAVVVGMMAITLNLLRYETQPPKPSASKPVKAEVAPLPELPQNFLTYRVAADKSLENLDALLARQAAQTAGASNLITAAVREEAGLTD